jgi:hypothetical protein
MGTNAEDLYWEWVGSVAGKVVGLLPMMQGCICEAQQRILEMEEIVRRLEMRVASLEAMGLSGTRSGKTPRLIIQAPDLPCKLCGRAPRLIGRAVCRECWQEKEFGITRD